MERQCKSCGKPLPKRYLFRRSYCSDACMSRLVESLAPARFWAKVSKSPGCWEWTGYLNNMGYGQLSLNNRCTYAHRYSWILAHGEIAKGLCVLHRCDNPKCVRPDHLFLGTKKQNSEDMMKKGRWTRPFIRRSVGEQVHSSKLKAIDIPVIRGRIQSGEPLQVIARSFGVSHGAIYHIAKGNTWSHVQ